MHTAMDLQPSIEWQMGTNHNTFHNQWCSLTLWSTSGHGVEDVTAGSNSLAMVPPIG